MKSNHSITINWTQLRHDNWSVYIAATEQGLCYVGSQDKPLTELEDWVQAKFPGCEIVQNDEAMQPYAAEMMEYFQGTRDRFELALDYKGTAFQMAVWNALCQIPYGQTFTYSDIANQIGKPAAVRAVGAAIGANPLLITVPCHRVIGKSGALTGYRGGLAMKTRLLELEGERARMRETMNYA
ncbi:MULTISPECIES: methylated-DNA--[protein]-cysteine S-methyltransferase [Paenibacillus]|uniref:methylated-DNA--[protein]-cysteine S-methyltransferase n=1 Tax=Paenibacillus lautus TaxID=1401 RepID=A0A1R1B6D8_PAELA|nr:methylated-DNA--[protein]-cysteine S-methyltransferase [Paenibacillus lautus]OME95059.1 cysteine methyltransferase [Paenibacillus lautus]